MSVKLLFEGEHAVAADKPAGWLSVPSRWGERDARPCLGRELERAVGGRLWPVHRLDEEASGVILFARDAATHAVLNGWFERHGVAKTYEAWTDVPETGPPAPFECTWRSTLLRGKRRAYESPHGKPCETRARLLGSASAPALRALAWELHPVTGRPHQLRVELARHGFPIVGDELYGGRQSLAPGAIALRCVRLAFADEEGAARLGLPVTVAAPGLQAWWEGLRTVTPA